MHHSKLVVVAELAQFGYCRPFIDGFESAFGTNAVGPCAWARYPKFQNSYRITWYLRTDHDPGVILDTLRGCFGPHGWSTHIGSEHIWGRPSGFQADETTDFGGPEFWAHLQPMSALEVESIPQMERGPDFDESSPHFVRVSTEGDVTGEFGGGSG